MDEIIEEISDKIFLDKLKNEFIESVKGYVVQLKELRSSEKYSEMRKIAHDIKGIASVFGFNRGSELAADFLSCSNADVKDKNKLGAIYSELIQYLEQNVLEINLEGK